MPLLLIRKLDLWEVLPPQRSHGNTAGSAARPPRISQRVLMDQRLYVFPLFYYQEKEQAVIHYFFFRRLTVLHPPLPPLVPPPSPPPSPPPPSLLSRRVPPTSPVPPPCSPFLSSSFYPPPVPLFDRVTLLYSVACTGGESAPSRGGSNATPRLQELEARGRVRPYPDLHSR